MQPILLKRSDTGLKMIIISTGIAALVLAFICTVITLIVVQSNTATMLLLLIVWIGLAVAWLGQAVYLWVTWRTEAYQLNEKSIIVQKKRGILGSEQSIYRYESILSVNLRQSYLGKKYHYGDITIEMPKAPEPVVLRHVDHPSEQLKELQGRVSARGASTHNLVT